MTLITVLGSSGFIGSHLVKHVEQLGLECFAPARGADLAGRKLGHVIYAIGLTADFRTRPFDTVEAHVGKLIEILKTCEFESLVYLSSTRLYKHSHVGASNEDAMLGVYPTNPEDIFNLSKAMGENLLLSSNRPGVRAVRLSNVYGNDFSSENFLTSIIKDAITDKQVTLRTTMDSAKDYISIVDVVDVLIKISLRGQSAIYNLAAGVNFSNSELMTALSNATGCQVAVSPQAERIVFPPIDITRVKDEFGFTPSANVLSDMPMLVESFRAIERAV